MVKRRCGPGRRAVARRAIRRESTRDMIGISRPSEVRLVAPIAVCRKTAGEVIVDVALSAGNRDVCAGQRERGLVVVKLSVQPCGRAVANLAGGRESRRYVIGIGGPGEISLVATETIRRQRGEVVVDVAGCARNGRVRAGEREWGVVVIKDCPCPRSRVMAYDAVGREIRGIVIGIGRPGEIRLVTAITIRG